MSYNGSTRVSKTFSVGSIPTTGAKNKKNNVVDTAQKQIYSYRMASTKKPIVPENTCPYIDMVQELIGQMSVEDDIDWRKKQAELADNLLEYIRASNLELREGGKYWYNRAKRMKGNV